MEIEVTNLIALIVVALGLGAIYGSYATRKHLRKLDKAKGDEK